MLAFLTSRSSKNLQLKSTENIINTPAAPETQPDIDEAILHVKPAFDTALSPQDSLQATTTQCFINVLILDSDNQQSQLPAIENPPSPEPKQGSVINGEVIIHVKSAVDTALLPQITPQDTTKCSIKVQNLEPKHLRLVKR